MVTFLDNWDTLNKMPIIHQVTYESRKRTANGDGEDHSDVEEAERPCAKGAQLTLFVELINLMFRYPYRI